MKQPHDTPETAQSQNRAILAHLQAGRSITPLEALHFYSCFRLSARIYDLRQRDYNIQVRRVRFIAPSGAVGSYAEYSLLNDAKNG